MKSTLYMKQIRVLLAISGLCLLLLVAGIWMLVAPHSSQTEIPVSPSIADTIPMPYSPVA